MKLNKNNYPYYAIGKKCSYSSLKAMAKDDLIEVLIDGAVEDAVAITGNKYIQDELPNTIVKMVVYNYNRLGTEGLENESYSGVTYNYLDGYPQDILNTLNKKRGRIYFIQ